MLLIDGHNLIPKIPGLDLRSMDDEQQLIGYLNEYCAARGRSLEVFFDGAPAGYAGVRPFGRVTARFVQKGRTADEAIRLRLEQMGRGARNITVVSSDRQVQAEARNHGAKVLRSEDFADELNAVRRALKPQSEAGPAASAAPDELKEFFDLFGGEPQEGPPPPKRAKKRGKPPSKL